MSTTGNISQHWSPHQKEQQKDILRGKASVVRKGFKAALGRSPIKYFYVVRYSFWFWKMIPCVYAVSELPQAPCSIYRYKEVNIQSTTARWHSTMRVSFCALCFLISCNFCALSFSQPRHLWNLTYPALLHVFVSLHTCSDHGTKFSIESKLS